MRAHKHTRLFVRKTKRNSHALRQYLNRLSFSLIYVCARLVFVGFIFFFWRNQIIKKLLCLKAYCYCRFLLLAPNVCNHFSKHLWFFSFISFRWHGLYIHTRHQAMGCRNRIFSLTSSHYSIHKQQLCSLRIYLNETVIWSVFMATSYRAFTVCHSPFSCFNRI